ncbi:MAG TPA: DUF2207 domain-containing protein [Candidatus Moranbacteria bacterium]|nr:DUF2207 domain-containing protein [Candidatus Moranbacteria bacterium]HRZ33754.1 DUF2207 domain-containing protein [Candidatus Moranbacteria bacterium]
MKIIANIFQKIKFCAIFFWVALLIFPGVAFARENVYDWYIKDFNSEIIVNKDSTLNITETIVADCGKATGKHGIFRILPTNIKITDGATIKTPVTLLSITDANGKPYNYQETKNSSDDTITWKIGDADKTVSGVNVYKIRYLVKNVIRFSNSQFDELYWNLNGNFWDIETDKFHAKFIFPEEINRENSAVDYYTGALGSKSKGLANFYWSSPNILEFTSERTLLVREGITASITFPKNILTPYQFSFWELYGKYIFIIIPIITFIICFYLWWKFGKDPKVDKAIIPEYDAPGNLSPIELGMLMKNGMFNNNLITAEIIYFATRGIINIKEISEKILFFESKDYELEKKEGAEAEKNLNIAQKEILNFIFEDKKNKKISGLKNSFYKNIEEIKLATQQILGDKKLIDPKGLRIQRYLTGIIVIIFVFIGVILGNIFNLSSIYFYCCALSVLEIFIFAIFMPKRTIAGANLNWEIKGFKLFMETVDKDRAKFYEKENIFEKFLPYAIVFGITEEWIKRMEEIYGKDFYNTYAPAWYAGSLSSFNTDSFVSAMDNLSSDISSNTSAPSGSGGSGGSGGGGGGGGGGGW